MSNPLLLAAVRRVGSRGSSVLLRQNNAGHLKGCSSYHSLATNSFVFSRRSTISHPSFGTAFFSTTESDEENKTTMNKKSGESPEDQNKTKTSPNKMQANKKNKNPNPNKGKNSSNKEGSATATTASNTNMNEKGSNKKKNFRKFQNKKNRPKKANFAETVLEPAARGEVPPNRRGIPKLAGRKSHSSQPFGIHKKHPSHNVEDLVATEEDSSTRTILRSGKKLKDVVRQYQKKTVGDSQQQQQSDALQLLFDDNLDGIDPWDIDPDEEIEKHPQIAKEVDDDGKVTYALSFTERDFQSQDEGGNMATFSSPFDSSSSDSSSSSSDSSSDSDEELVQDGNLIYNEDGRNIRFDIGTNQSNRDIETGEILPGNPDEQFFAKDIFDFTDPFPTTPTSLANRVLPLQETGHQADDFVAAMYEHPTKYALIQHFQSNSAHRRPQLPKLQHIQYPPPDFITSGKNNNCFMYLSNVPNDDVNFSIDDSLACNHLSETVANLLQVSIVDVFCAHKHGAFVRFSSPKEAASTLQKSKSRRHNHQTSLLEIKLSSSTDDKMSNVNVTNIPTDMSTLELQNIFATFFPKDAGTIQIQNMTKEGAEVQISLPSNQVQKVLLSTPFRQEVEQVRKMYSHVSVFACHRERYIGGYTGYDKAEPFYHKGMHLDIDFGLPAHTVDNAGALRPDFYNSHASVWYITQLPLNTTKQQISNWLQPYCTLKRDVNGSIKFVTDADGQFQGQAYIGFDTDIDAQATLEGLLSHLSTTNPDDTVNPDETDSQTTQQTYTVNWLNETSRQIQISPLQDIVERGDKKKNKQVVGPRSERTEEELLQELDEEYMVEKYIDAEDIEFLKSVKVDIQVIKDAFLATRHGNVSYGMEDGGILGERYDDGKQPGDNFQEFCQLYVETLKELVATPENPGELYRGMFLPDEDQDIDIIREDFEREHARIEKIQRKHYPHAK